MGVIIQNQSIVRGNVVINRLNPPSPYNSLNTIANYLRGNMTAFRNPSFYTYWLDNGIPPTYSTAGIPDGVQINDGGADMFDGGNITTPWLRNNATYTTIAGWSAAVYPNAINYNSTTISNIDTDFFYMSLGYIRYSGGTQNPLYHPLTVIGTRFNQGSPVGWQIGGNSGADTLGTLASGLLYNGDVLSGFTVYAFFRETYNATDPSHCNLFILMGHPNWRSGYGTVRTFADPVTNGGCGGFLTMTGSSTNNLLTIQTLLSKASGVLVTSAECQTVVQNFVLKVKEAVNF
jgi:hypothetical protein